MKYHEPFRYINQAYEADRLRSKKNIHISLHCLSFHQRIADVLILLASSCAQHFLVLIRISIFKCSLFHIGCQSSQILLKFLLVIIVNSVPLLYACLKGVCRVPLNNVAFKLTKRLRLSYPCVSWASDFFYIK